MVHCEVISGDNPIGLFAANLLLQDTIERIHVGKEYGDIPRGLFIVRGENVVLMGEVVSVCVGGGGAGNSVSMFERYSRSLVYCAKLGSC